jgi:transposase
MSTTRDYVYFQQDGAPAYRAKNTNKYPQDASVFPYLFPWPAGSPDANPIEKFWSLMKQRIAARPTKKSALLVAIHEEWDSFTQQEIGNLTSSMLARVHAIGGHTQY